MAKTRIGCRIHPFVFLHVPVGERDVGRAIVITRRVIDDPIRLAWPEAVLISGVGRVHHEVGVIDRVRSLVQRDKNVRGPLDFAQPREDGEIRDRVCLP